MNSKEIIEKYTNCFVSLSKLSKEYNCSVNKIRKILVDNNITLRTNSEASINKFSNENAIIEEYNSGVSIIELSKKYNCGQGRINRLLKRNNIHIRGRSECQLTISTLIPDELYNEVASLYYSGMSIHKLAKHYNSNRGYIKAYMKRNNIITRKDYPDPVYPILLKDKELIIERYNKRRSIKPIAKYYNCSAWAVQHFMDVENITRKHKPYKVDIPLKDIPKISRLHYEKDYTLQQLGDLYGCAGVTMAEFMDANNVKRRTLDESKRTETRVIGAFKKWKTSCYRLKPYTLPSGKIIKLQGYEPQFLDYVFENKLYKEEDFDFSTKRIQYVFNNKNHYYFPDFYIPKDNLIIEIKSTYILKRQGNERNIAKHNATIKSGYKYLMLIDNNFKEINKKL